jgi:hypothetical protein
VECKAAASAVAQAVVAAPVRAVADPEENFSGGQTHEWGLLFEKFKQFKQFSYKYIEILQKFKILSGGQGLH